MTKYINILFIVFLIHIFLIKPSHAEVVISGVDLKICKDTVPDECIRLIIDKVFASEDLSQYNYGPHLVEIINKDKVVKIVATSGSVNFNLRLIFYKYLGANNVEVEIKRDLETLEIK